MHAIATLSVRNGLLFNALALLVKYTAGSLCIYRLHPDPRFIQTQKILEVVKTAKTRNALWSGRTFTSIGFPSLREPVSPAPASNYPSLRSRHNPPPRRRHTSRPDQDELSLCRFARLLAAAAVPAAGSQLKLRTSAWVRLTSVSSHLWHLMSGRMAKGSW